MHPEKQDCAIIATPGGMAIDLSEQQSLKAFFPITVTPLGIHRDARRAHPQKTPSSIIVSTESRSNVTMRKPLHKEKHRASRIATLLGMHIDLSPSHEEKIEELIEVKIDPFSNTTVRNLSTSVFARISNVFTVAGIHTDLCMGKKKTRSKLKVSRNTLSTRQAYPYWEQVDLPNKQEPTGLDKRILARNAISGNLKKYAIELSSRQNVWDC
jgi:hypothetical protein